ncbi:TPA: hypothetical protein N0F65_011148 [Lagenidium giganteum]|uniref:NADAR domain-containing protein n=1 Tax=Lagenidium giganteum TaxID=4803 RepID=A0AAV2Z400_9STRA|nr:TPA: hypothetical protein N0F65_011148 [Lagenidium giganteum]
METKRAVYFYHSRDQIHGCLSNFFKCTFVDDHGRKFQSSEHYFSKRKQELFDPDNHELAAGIMVANAPAIAKQLGRQVRNYDDRVWQAVRFDVMVEALKLKFTSCDELRDDLLSTGSKMLYNASPRDTLGGIGKSVEDVRTLFRYSPALMRVGDVDEETQLEVHGANLLGHALMHVRSWLRAQPQAIVH